MKKVLSKMACIAIAMLLISTTVSYAAAAVSTDGPRIYRGPQDVYKDTDAIRKGKPPGTPGNGPPEKPPEEPEEPPVDKWAVVIGISDYRGWQYDLRYCDDDARDMYNYLLSKGYPSGNIKLLLDGSATARKIIAAIDWLGSKEGPDSEVVFFYSGHGSTYDGYNDGDAEYTDEAIVSADLYLILDGQLKQKFSTFESHKISFTFDSCFSGGMDDLEESGRVVVAACSETQYSYDGSSEQQNGVFTYYYMEGLSSYNAVESAFTYAKPLAHDFAANNYGAEMDPEMHDQYDGNWTF